MRTTIILILLVATSVAVTNAQVLQRGTFLSAGFLVGLLGFWLGAKKTIEECRSQAMKRPPCTDEAEAATNGNTVTGSYCKCEC